MQPPLHTPSIAFKNIITPATLEERFLLLSRLVWAVDELRPMQLHTVKVIYEHEQVAVIDVTDGDKSHNICLTGTFLGGVHLIFNPILRLPPTS